MRAAVLLGLVCLAWLQPAGPSGVLAARRGSPLLTEDAPRRRPAMSAECQFGRQLYELGSTWFADLGPPFGVMYCIRCECNAVQKKRRIVARSQCRNIKNECPVPSCDEPVLLPGRCCKVCAGDLHSPDIVQDIPQPAPSEDTEKSMKGFAALLTGRTSLRELDTKYAATARFTFHKKNLYYSLVHSADMPRPRALHFLDASGNILEEQLLTESGYRNATGKICGVWWRVPRSYRQLLRDERVHVALLTDAPSHVEEPRALGGPVARYKGLATELFSALLETAPENPSRGAGGTAIVTASSSAPSVHLSIVFSGVFSPDDVADVPLLVRLASDKHLVLEEVVRVHKPSHELNTIEVRSAVKAADLRLLARGRLQLSVASRHHPEYRVQGDVTTRVACDLFQATLSSAEADETAGGEAAATAAEGASTSISPSATTASGLAWMHLTRDGALVYYVRLDELDAPILGLSLASGRGRRRQELEDLTPSFASGWANGSLERLSPRELEQLYAGELSVNVATSDRDSLVRGRITAHPAADPRLSDAPLLLKRADTDQPASLMGLAWAAVDHECRLQYEVSLSGLSGGEQLELHLEDLPILVPGAPVSRRRIVQFSGSQFEGFVIGLSDVELARIDSGVAFLDVVDAHTNSSLLRARIEHVRVPASCLPRYTDNDLPLMSHDAHPSEPRSCFHEARFHKEGVQWRSERDVCSMCSCQHGRVKCEPVVCPPTPCVNPTRLPGDCCSSCYGAAATESNASETRGCHFAGPFYRAGSAWHPYLPPLGFNRCVVCSCNTNTLEVQCSPVQCPPLPCSEKVAFRADRNACCKQCPASTPAPALSPSEQQDQTSPRTAQDVLDEGGCVVRKEAFSNGQEWHPRIGPHGLDKCITCRCKTGKMTCTRKTCQRPACRRRAAVKDDECCQQCHRIRRHRTAASLANGPS